MNHLLLRRSELLSIAIALAMLLAIVFFSTVDWVEYRRNRNEVIRARGIFEHTSALLASLTEAEAAQRGFLLTGEPSYLGLYQQDLELIPQHLHALDEEAAGDEYLTLRLIPVRGDIAEKMAEIAHTIQLHKQGDLQTSLELVRSGRGKELMDSIRRGLRGISGYESDLIGTHSRQVRFRSDRAHLVTITGSLVLIGLLGLGALAISRATSRREELIKDLERERKQTSEVRDLLETTLLSIHDAVVVSDNRGRVTFLNRMAEDLTGWKTEEVTGKPIASVFSLVDEETSEPIENPALQVIDHGESIHSSKRPLFATRAGALLPVEHSAAPIRDRDGKTLGAVLVFRDATSRRNAELERERLLQEAQEARADAERQRSHIHSLFLQAPAIINIHRGPDHIFELLHPLMRKLLGGSDVAGKSAREALPESLNQPFLALLDEAFRSDAPQSVEAMEVELRQEDGSMKRVVLNAIARPWRDANGAVAGVVTLAIDVTEQARTKREMEATREQLRQTAKLESLGVLAGGLAHDFNNLLVGVMGNASLALESLPPASGEREMLQEVMKASERAAALVRQMLAFSGKGRFVVERVDFSHLAKEILPLIQGSVPKSVLLNLRFAEGLPPVEADVSQLEQVVMNLVINAAEACAADSGSVTIRTSQLMVDQYARSAFGLQEIEPGPYVCLEVSDNGCGMDEDTQAKIFDPFFTTKFTGRGLGLSAVIGIIRAHNGAIKVYSSLGKGSTFKVLLPAAAKGGKPHFDPPRSATLRGEGSVLVVDDEDIVRTTAKLTLERFGYRVMAVENGKAAVELFRKSANEIQVVLLDLTMPLMGGETTLDHLRAIRPDIRVILSSGFDETEATRRFQGKGLVGFIQKPYAASQLVEMVRAAL